MPTKLYVSNLTPDCNDADLHGLFSEFGVVSELDIIKNYAFVHMLNHGDAEKAVASLNNRELHGNNIKVQFSRTQNINRANKQPLPRFDRPDGNFRGRGRGDFHGRDGRGGRGGFQGRGGGNFRGRGGNDFRGRGGFHGDRGGFQRGRAKPYDRPFNARPNFQGHNQFNQDNNYQQIRPLIDGPISNSFPRPSQNQFQRPQQNLPNLMAQQNQIPPQAHAPPSQQHQPAAQSMIPQSMPGQSVPVQPHANLGYPTQAPPNQQLTPQAPVGQPLAYSNMMFQNHQLAQPVHAAIPTQVLTPNANPQPQPGVINQPGVQQVLPPTSVPGATVQQQPGVVPSVGYTVYERYVDYRNPADSQALTSQPNTTAMPAGYQQVGQTPGQVATNKDPYANAQLQYERHAGATSRAAAYANAYYGSNTSSVTMPAGNMMQAVPVVAASPVVQPMPIQYPQ